jgi:hypothetical protein
MGSVNFMKLETAAKVLIADLFMKKLTERIPVINGSPKSLGKKKKRKKKSLKKCVQFV